MACPRHLRVALIAATLTPAVAAQEGKEQQIQGLRAALQSWTRDFQRREFRLRDTLELRYSSAFEYVRIGLDHRLFGRRSGRKSTHFVALQALLGAAEKHAGEAVVTALFPLAAFGYDHELHRGEVMLVRDAGRNAILRMNEPTVWRLVQHVAASTHPRDELYRPAALRLLGTKQLVAARKPVEEALFASDAAVRLAAAEALGQIRHVASLPLLVKAIERERHPVVAVAVLDAADRTLRRRGEDLVEADWAPVVDASLRTLGRAGWRTDLATVRLARRYPRRMTVPILIKLLGAEARGQTDDPMLKLVNVDASPLLAHEAWLSLRRLTGALLPRDAAKWTEFWAKEKDDVVMAPPIDDAAVRVSTRAAGGFFGIPVRGRDVIFVIDTSHSMRDAVERDQNDSKEAKVVQRMRRSGTTGKGDRWTRLDAAKEQVLIAIAGMGPRSHFRIVTFADDVRAWHRRPVRASRHAVRTLMKTFQRVRPKGFTNTFAALAHILDAGVDDRVDEVFFLSDGEPSEGVLQDAQKILARATRLNRLRQVRINTVFTGSGEGADFMRALAAQNHGIFVHYGQ